MVPASSTAIIETRSIPPLPGLRTSLQIARMPVHVEFTDNIQRHVQLLPRKVEASTVREALDAIFGDQPRARGYILDERDRLRKHMNIFVNGERIADREHLSDPLPDGAELYVMQALSGG